MNKDVRVSVGQSLFDISVQQCGSIEAVFAIAERNGLSITDELDPGMLIEIAEAEVIDAPVASFYQMRGLRPATDAPSPSTGSGTGGGIDDLLDDGIDFMAVEVDNVVM